MLEEMMSSDSESAQYKYDQEQKKLESVVKINLVFYPVYYGHTGYPGILPEHAAQLDGRRPSQNEGVEKQQ